MRHDPTAHESVTFYRRIIISRKEVMSLFGDMIGPKMGSWSIRSEKDPRWNKSGRAKGLVCMGGPQEMKDWIDECKKNFGEPPDDCECFFMKD
jgi:hypothetical protein